MTAKIKEVLHSLAITGNYKGYIFTIISCELVAENPMRLHNARNEIYPKVAEMCNCNIQTVEKNIRTIIGRAWEKRPNRLSELAGYPLSAPPTVAPFLDMIVTYVNEAPAHKKR